MEEKKPTILTDEQMRPGMEVDAHLRKHGRLPGEQKTSEEKKETIESFFKEAFNVDGTAEIVSNSRKAKRSFKILSVVKLTDSRRGEFYIASVTPKK